MNAGLRGEGEGNRGAQVKALKKTKPCTLLFCLICRPSQGGGIERKKC